MIAFSRRSTSIQKVSSQSINTGFAPNSAIAPTVATNVLAAVITSSPNETPFAFNESLIASVPEFTPNACLTPISFEKLASNFFKGAPSVKSPVLTKSLSSDHKSSQSENCWGK